MMPLPSPRSQTPFGNAFLETLFRVRRSCRVRSIRAKGHRGRERRRVKFGWNEHGRKPLKTRETEFREVRSQTEFGNEGDSGTRAIRERGYAKESATMAALA